MKLFNHCGWQAESESDASLPHQYSLMARQGMFAVGVVVEGMQYVHMADRIGLERGGLARMLLGTNFSWLDIGMYGLGCLSVFYLDEAWSRRTSQGSDAQWNENSR